MWSRHPSRLIRPPVGADADGDFAASIAPQPPSAGGDKVKYFEGTPIPTTLLAVALLALAGSMGALQEQLWFGAVTLAGLTLHPLVLIFTLSGSMMISRMRIRKL